MKNKMLQMVRDSTKLDVEDVKLEGGVWKARVRGGQWEEVGALIAKAPIKKLEVKTGTQSPR